MTPSLAASAVPESPPPEGRGSKYLPELDGLRAFAVLAVMLSHLPFHQWIKGGQVGVDVFFVLSGFLITSLMLDETRVAGTISFKQFYARRALRLLPALVATVVVITVITWAAGYPLGLRASEARLVALAALFYFSCWCAAQDVNLNPFGHAWSLSVEEQPFLRMKRRFEAK